MLNIVMITENPIAGAPLNLSRCLNKYQGHKVNSRHIAASDRNENRVFGQDVIIDSTPEHELRELLEKADVIHFHNFYKNQHLFRKYPQFWEIVMRKKRVWQVHSQREISWVRLEDALVDHHMKKLVIGQYHPRQWPECQVVPNVIDIWDERLMPDWSVKNEKPRVVYSPSRIRCPGWDDKSYDQVVPVLQHLVNNHIVTAEVIHDVPYEECLRSRKKADISIDEISTGSYHLTSLESLSAGLVTIAGLDDIQIRTLCDLTGSSEERLPWVIPYPGCLEGEILETILDKNERLHLKRAKSRDWMTKYWEPCITTRKFVEIYEQL